MVTPFNFQENFCNFSDLIMKMIVVLKIQFIKSKAKKKPKYFSFR